MTSKYTFPKFWNFNPSSVANIAFSSQFWIDGVTKLIQDFKLLRERFRKRIIYHLSINIDTWNTNLDLFNSFYELMSSPRGVKTSKFLILHLKFPFNIDFHLSITVGTWNTSLGPFWPSFGLMTSPWESKLQYFEKVISGTNSSLQSSIKYWFRSFYHLQYMIYNFGLFLPNLTS